MLSFFMRVISIYKREILLLFLVGVFLLTIIPILMYIYFARDLQSKDAIMNRKNTGVILLDRNNKPFFTFYQARSKDPLPISEIPKNVQNAAIAVEDKDFYAHPGFSLSSIMRSVLQNIEVQDFAYGGSTITQQLVKNALLTSEKSFLRKYQEIVLATEIERLYTKSEILEMYLNSVYFGEGAFGIEEAANTYFNKSAKDLDLAESALLVSILPMPSRLSPLSGDRQEAFKRQEIVLTKMQEEGYIALQEKNTALQKKLLFSSSPEDINRIAPHFALMVRDQLIEKYGEETISRSGFTVKTTIDLDYQKYAENVVKDQVDSLRFSQVTNGAAVAIDPKTGEILVMVGSTDWFNNLFGKVNIATTPRQPGSAFKPIVYAKALEDRVITPATVLTDQPTTFSGNYKPQNYDKKFRGKVLVRRALANSLNVPSVEVMSKVGVEKILSYSRQLGITSLKGPSNYGFSLVLGTGEVSLLEMTNVYAAFANKGVKNEPTSILQITNKYYEVVFRNTTYPQEVIDPKVVFLISSILSDIAARREIFGDSLTISRVAAVKTGTTENYRDAWTLGYTPQIAVGAWVGNNDATAMNQIAGSLGAAPIWSGLIEYYVRDLPVETFEPPTGVISKTICQTNGLLARNATSSAFAEFFIAGTEPTQYCTFMPTVTEKKDEKKDDEDEPTPTQIPPTEAVDESKNKKEKKNEKDVQIEIINIPSLLH